MFAGAVASADGLIPNRDFFAQYGPLAPFIHGIWLRIFGDTLFNLRIFTALLLAVTGPLVFIVVSNYQSHKTAFLAQLAWILSYPIQPLPHSMPWATVISSFLMVLAIYCYLKTKSSQHPAFWGVIVGSIVGTLFLLRFQLILLLIFTLLVFNPFGKQFNRWVASTNKTISISAISSFSISVLIMIRLDSLDEYVVQCITWPSEYYGLTYLPWNIFSKEGFIYWSTWYYYPFFFLFFYFAFKHFRGFPKTLKSNSSLGRKLVFLFLLLLILIAYSLFSNYSVEPKSYLNPILQLQWLFLRIPIAFYFFLSVFFVSRFIRGLFQLKKFKKGNFVSIVALCAVFLLYPGSDPIHLWWSAPVLLAAFFVEFHPNSILRNSTVVDQRSLNGIFVTLIMFSVALIPQTFFKERTTFAAPILKGLFAPQSYVDSLDATLLAITSFVDEHRNHSHLSFDCRDGLYAVATGSFLSIDRQFVSWGPDLDAKSHEVENVFVCDISDTDLAARYPKEAFKVISRIRTGEGRWNVIVSNS